MRRDKETPDAPRPRRADRRRVRPLRREEPVPVEGLTGLIESMPMREREMRDDGCAGA